MRRAGLLPASWALVACTASAWAQDRPLLTEPATAAPRGTLSIEAGVDAMAGERSYVSEELRTRWEGPLLRATYSPSDDVELDVEWVARVGVVDEAGRGEIQDSDWGDVTLRAKWCFRERRGGTSIAARFGVILPQTSFEDDRFRALGLGPNTLRAFVEALLGRSLGPARLSANAGLFLHDEVLRPHDQRDFLSFALALEWPLDERLTLVAEAAGRAGEGKPGADARSEARAGLRFACGGLRLDAAVRRGFQERTGTWGVTTGLTWTRRPGRRD